MKNKKMQGWAVVCLVAVTAVLLSACSAQKGSENLLSETTKNKQTVNLFSPMEKSIPNAVNVARTAADLTVAMAEEQLDVIVDYWTYTAKDYQDRNYDEVCLDRARNNMDDIYLLNPDVILKLGAEGALMDLSGLDSAKNLREIIRVANTVDGKLVAIPQEVVAYGLFVNADLFKQYDLALPNTPEEFLECCRVFQENGIETPVGANRWWLETFVLAQAYADLYNGGNTQAEIEALNSGETRYSDYMRPGFEFLKTMIDQGYIDAEKALVSEAGRGEVKKSQDKQEPLSAPPCKQAPQSQERQRGCCRFRNLADGKGMNSHGTAIACRAGPAPQGQPVQVKN